MNHPRQFWGGGVHGKVCWLIAYLCVCHNVIVRVSLLHFTRVDTIQYYVMTKLKHSIIQISAYIMFYCSRLVVVTIIIITDANIESELNMKELPTIGRPCNINS